MYNREVRLGLAAPPDSRHSVLAPQFPKDASMVDRPAHLSKFEFVTLSSLRAVQLLQGSVPRITTAHKRVIIAQMEVAQGLVVRSDNLPTVAVLPD